MGVLETEEPDKVGVSERKTEAGGDKSDDAKTGVHKDDECCDVKEESFVGSEVAEVDLIGVYHEHRTPTCILSVLPERLTVLLKSCVAFLVFSQRYENCSILPSLHSPCEALKAQISPTCIVVDTIGVSAGVLICC